MAAVVDCDQREKELKEFDESKAGVKGLADAGVTKLPSMFVHPPENLLNSSFPQDDEQYQKFRNLQLPVIDLSGFDNFERRKVIITDINKAAESWGFFQLVNHGIPLGLMEGIQKSIRGFHELPQKEKVKWYSSDFTQKVRFFSNFNLKVSTPAAWRDTLSCKVLEDPESFEAIPQVCRREVSEYIKHIDGVQEKLSELFSEALGLSSDYLASIGCFKSRSLECHYHPICPEPHLTMGGVKHSDLPFLTLLLQDGVGGLQVLHQNVWIDVPPMKGALIANIGDMMQVITNGKFKSVEHRVLMKPTVEPRISIACFLNTDDLQKSYGPIKELISENNPPIYSEVKFEEQIKKLYNL
ncbi:putative oxoglutarate/iron-dependent dioxygenase, non-heme dioxygenase domain-containing protein [Rosa chinensis]|uniref:Putative oxoglutarate/iron-dependent dioxygenase, non-heme dioxygenase domain-containing protein n=1 Tax=Rosa chinensis TaxID=74649 RepID=A0A2P6Q195_ROSCH|nr:1-aminocyclopropane-1-carboxylate oxidase homolog 10 [Rosa chinensis]PRQ27943.1 putative oxoglutarate/iron-dependent dioxygenase, non-heme dioxygenase domain-containing protein [Rosa chinensis]